MRAFKRYLPVALLGFSACLATGSEPGPAPVLSTELTVDTGYTPALEYPELQKGQFPVFVLRWTPAASADHYVVRVSAEPITADNWDRAVPVDTVAGGQDTCWVSLDPVVYRNTCIGCGICVGVCPNQAITLVDGRAVIDPSLCTSCGQCVINCPVNAITDTRYGQFYYFALRAYSAEGAPSEQVACTSDAFRIIYYNDPDRCARCHDVSTYCTTCYMLTETPACPVDAIYWDEDWLYILDMSKCIFCGRCYTHCRTLGLWSLSNFVERLQ
jgi:ferredoxin